MLFGVYNKFVIFSSQVYIHSLLTTGRKKFSPQVNRFSIRFPQLISNRRASNPHEQQIGSSGYDNPDGRRT